MSAMLVVYEIQLMYCLVIQTALLRTQIHSSFVQENFINGNI